MNQEFYFPFGNMLKKVEQENKNATEAFVLGVYASAVHARWVDKDGKQKVAALAVASEPEIFWTGDNANEIIKTIKIPAELGKLELPKNKKLNGPSGNVLDELFLAPLGLDRENTWLCDILPYSRVNEKQKSALDKFYNTEIIEKYQLRPANIPEFKKSDLDSSIRRDEILEELKMSKANKLILLGDLPIKYFLSYFDNRFKKLVDFGKDPQNYGVQREVKINNKSYQIIALCHPRQAGRLGSSDEAWGKLHDRWVEKMKGTMILN